jgi:SOS-response transcriptional repressor LexA
VHDLNERHGMNLSDAHRLHLEAMALDMAADPEVRLEASANSFENFRLEFDKRFTSAITKEMQRNETFSLALLNDDELRAEVAGGMAVEVYTRARVAWQREIPIGDLLARGEDAYLEFKSTLEWDLKEGRRNKALRTPALKTVAAFLNSRYGGTLVIGVADDRSIVGLEHDYEALHREGKDDTDWFQLHLGNLTQNAMGATAAARITMQIHRVDRHDICRVHVEPSSRPVYARLADTGESFFVRLNGRTSEIKEKDEIRRYVEDRWGPPIGAPAESKPALPLVPAAEADKYRRHLPVYSLEAAAGHFLENRPVEELGWVEVPQSLHPREGMFVAQVRGHSMEPRVPDNSWVVFRSNVVGVREGRLLLVELTEADDPEGGGRYTLKRWHSEKKSVEAHEGGWRHEHILLQSLNPRYAPIAVEGSEDVRVVSEYVATLPKT